MNKKNRLITFFLATLLTVSVLAYFNFNDITALPEPAKSQSQILDTAELDFYARHVKQNSFCRKNSLKAEDFETIAQLTAFGDFKTPVDIEENFLTPGFICFVRDTVWKSYFAHIETLANNNKEKAALLLNQYIFLVARMVTKDWLLFDRYSEIKTLNEQLSWIQNSNLKNLLDKNKSLTPLRDLNFIEFIKDAADKEKWLNFSLVRKVNPKSFMLINSKNGFSQIESSIFFQKNRTHEHINKNWDHQIANIENCLSEQKTNKLSELQNYCLKSYEKYETSIAQKYLFNTKGAAIINNSRQLELQQLFIQIYIELKKFNQLEKSL